MDQIHRRIEFTRDESRFCIGQTIVGFGGGDYPEGTFAPTDKFAKISIHVWGAIGVGFKSMLIVFVTNVNSAVYVRGLVHSVFVPLIDQDYRERC
jgi:hypothetical protein